MEEKIDKKNSKLPDQNSRTSAILLKWQWATIMHPTLVRRATQRPSRLPWIPCSCSADLLCWFAVQLNNSWENLQAIAERLFSASSNISHIVNNSRCEQKSLAYRGVCAPWKFIFHESPSRWIMKRGLWGDTADNGKWGHICGPVLPPQMYYPATSTLRPLLHFLHDSPQIYSRKGNLAARGGLDNHLSDKFALSLRELCFFFLFFFLLRNWLHRVSV